MPSNSHAQKLRDLVSGLSQVILGKEEVIRNVVIGLAAGGHILFEDVPGVGKTTLVKSISKALASDFNRVQCTPDLLPADITGVSVYNQFSGEWTLQKGPIFTQILLADEINRTSPKTQSALLESMEECQVTIEGTSYHLPRPFLVLATQNPTEYSGTFPLPESQLDRFMLSLSLGYPEKNSEIKMLTYGMDENPLKFVDRVITPEELLEIQEEIKNLYVDDSLLKYITELSIASRNHEQIELGVSPRASLHLLRCAKACAYLQGRDFVLPDDIQNMLHYVFRHRLIVDQSSYLNNIGRDEVLRELISLVPVPSSTGRW